MRRAVLIGGAGLTLIVVLAVIGVVALASGWMPASAAALPSGPALNAPGVAPAASDAVAQPAMSSQYDLSGDWNASTGGGMYGGMSADSSSANAPHANGHCNRNSAQSNTDAGY